MTKEVIISSNSQNVVLKISSPNIPTQIIKKYFKKSFRSEIFKRQRRSKEPIHEIDLISTEIKVLRSLKHVNLVHLIRLEESDFSIDLVMEYGGEPLNYEEQIPKLLLKYHILQILHGLKHLHDNNIIHGDLKPGNILLSENQTIKICDFGSSMMVSKEGIIPKFPKSTPIFYTPEHSQRILGTSESNDPILGKPLDIWTLGITLYFLILKKSPHPTDLTVIQLCERIEDYECWIPIGFHPYGDLIMSCLQRNPSKRSNIDELISYFNNVHVF